MTSESSIPAILGGVPVRPQGPPPWPLADPEVEQALREVYQDGSWGKYHGNYVQRLEEKLAAYHGVPFGMTLASGTFAVETALRALRLGPGDEVLLAAYDYPGNFLAVHAVGATPVLVDVDPDNWNLDPTQLDAAIGPITKAIIVSHLHGGIVPTPEVMDVARARRLAVVEDAAQCPGAKVHGKIAGTWGDVGILSFGGSKLLTAGRGGAILTHDPGIHQRARVALHRGNHICPLSELQAAVLFPQLEKLEVRNAVRLENAVYLAKQLETIPGIHAFANRDTQSKPAYYKLGIQVDADRFGLPRDRIAACLRAEGIAIDEGFKAFHVGRSPNRFRASGPLAQAERAHTGVLVLHHPVLLETPAEMDEIIRAFRKIHCHVAILGE